MYVYIYVDVFYVIPNEPQICVFPISQMNPLNACLFCNSKLIYQYL